jgi:argininosuccinate lyase
MTEQKSIKSKTKNTNQSWGGRFNEPVDAFVARFTASVNFDKRLYEHDILGSIAHASMLSDSGVISESEAKQIIEELQNIARDIDTGAFTWTEDLEDVHMNIEACSHRSDRKGGKKASYWSIKK